MKIVSWNCASKFREKYTSIIEENADIYVICECENPAEAKVKNYVEFAGENYFWTGNIHWKGLGIFAKDNEGNAKDQTNLNKKLNNNGLFSAYHDLTNEKQGKETQSTFYQSRHLDQLYHIDYVYTGKDRVISFQIGDAEKWIELSDHMPIIFEIKVE